MSQQTRINCQLSVTETESLDLGTRQWAPSLAVSQTLADGTGASQSDLNFFDIRTVSSSPDDVDLVGSLTKQLGGGTISFVEVTAIAVYNSSSSYHLYCYAPTNGVSWLPNSTYPVQLGPGGSFFLTKPDAAGLPCTAGTGDLVRFASVTGSSLDYYLGVTGRSA